MKKYFNTDSTGKGNNGNGNNGNNGNGNNGNNGNGSNPDTNSNNTKPGKYENLQFFYHPDHLGSSNYITDASGEVYQHNEYFPYGETFVEERNAAEYTNYLFSGKELDEETGLYYFGARYQDPRTSQFLNVDPKMDKYPDVSSYSYCFNNPIKIIDPNGEEGIVISGQPGGHKNKEHFLVNGLDRAKRAQQKIKTSTEKVTWMVYNDGSTDKGHSKEMIAKYKKEAEKLGINFKEVSSVSEIVDYINNKTEKSKRSADKISSFYYIGHAKPSKLNPGYPEEKGALDPDNFSENAFASGAWINVVGGCRTDVDDSWIWDDSVVDKFRKKVDKNSTINGSDVRVQYDGGVRSDEQLLKANKGSIVTVKGKRK